MMPSVNPKPPFTNCSLASGDTSASSAGSSLTMVGLSPCACALAAQTPRVTVNRTAAEIEYFFIKHPSNPTCGKAGEIRKSNLLARRTISKHRDQQGGRLGINCEIFSRTGNKPAAPSVMHVVTGLRADRLSHLIGGECHAGQDRPPGFPEARWYGRRRVRLRARGLRHNRRRGAGRLLLRSALGHALGFPGTG